MESIDTTTKLPINITVIEPFQRNQNKQHAEETLFSETELGLQQMKNLHQSITPQTHHPDIASENHEQGLGGTGLWQMPINSLIEM